MTNRQLNRKEIKRRERAKVFYAKIKYVASSLVFLAIGASIPFSMSQISQARNMPTDSVEDVVIQSEQEPMVELPPTPTGFEEFDDLDPCVYSMVPCRGETLQDWRKQDIEQMIRTAANEYGLDPDHAVILAQCESGLNERAANPHSSAKGVYQFLDGTWKYINAEGHQFDAEENIKQFMIWYPIAPHWWECE